MVAGSERPVDPCDTSRSLPASSRGSCPIPSQRGGRGGHAEWNGRLLPPAGGPVGEVLKQQDTKWAPNLQFSRQATLNLRPLWTAIPEHALLVVRTRCGRPPRSR